MKRNLLLLFLTITAIPYSQTFDTLDKKEGLKSFEGYFDFWYAENEDKIYLRVSNIGEEFLYVNALSSGIGSNDIGLDRGQLGNTAVVKFQRAGQKLLLVQPNQNYRAVSNNEYERKSVEQAFAKSVLFGFEIIEEAVDGFLIDITPFILRDAHGVAEKLKATNQGDYRLDNTKSALSLERTKSFPKNTEFEAMLTFTGTPKGSYVKSVVPDASKITVGQHHSFVELPEKEFKKRIFNTRSGAYPLVYQDYSTPVYAPLTKRYTIRHRLEKKHPDSTVSEAIEPIVYYLDPGTPEPVRSALIEGAAWWNQAFEFAGYKNAFQVKMLPKDADPLDLRYNVIQWVHRSTRGWSYGASVIDPRTGEILKGHVSLGSLRIRQDLMIAQALMNKPFEHSDENYSAMLEMALARIRQLSAHEVGHTLGFSHNFASSSNGRKSVMDYPHPLLTFKDNQIDFSNAYDVGIGDWDKLTVAYSYGEPDQGQTENEYLKLILDKAKDDGLQFISDADARARGGAHAYAHLWDNASNPSDELNRIMEIRSQAISNFTIDNIKTNEPYSLLEDVFVPLYFLHRYQTEAAVKMIGGLDYNYTTKGSGLKVLETVSKSEQIKALDAVINTLDSENIAIPKSLLGLFPPRAYGYPRTRESFKSNTGISFDALGATSTASDFTLGLLLHPERANRLIQQKALEPENLDLTEVIDALLKNTFYKKTNSDYLKEAQNTINFNVLKHLMNLSAHQKSIPQVKAIANHSLLKLKDEYKKDKTALGKEITYRINKFLENPEKFDVFSSPEIPDGSPIGSFLCINE